jgi:hypothetical protein
LHSSLWITILPFFLPFVIFSMVYYLVYNPGTAKKVVFSSSFNQPFCQIILGSSPNELGERDQWSLIPPVAFELLSKIPHYECPSPFRGKPYLKTLSKLRRQISSDTGLLSLITWKCKWFTLFTMENARVKSVGFAHHNPSRNLLKKTLFLLYSASLWPDPRDRLERVLTGVIFRRRGFFTDAFGFNQKWIKLSLDKW